jgi:hypothetical protein
MIDSRIRSRRSGAIIAAALFIIAAMPGLATAANTRGLLIGSPVLPTGVTNGILTPTPVSRPDSGVHSTYLEVEILSTDNQNLAHTVLTVTVPKQTGLTVHDPVDPAGGTDAGACDPVASATDTVFTCDYGSITPANPERTIAFVMDIASAFTVLGQAGTFVSAKVTTNNENGTNLQTFLADSKSFQVQDFSPNHLASWVPSGEPNVTFSTSPLGDPNAGAFSSTIAFDTSANEAVALTDGTTTVNYICRTDLNPCQDEYSEATTTSGSFGSSPYFTWTLRARVSKMYSLSQGFVLHYPTGATTYVFNNSEYWTLLFKDKSSFCGSLEITANGHCIKTLTLTKLDKTSNLLTLVVVMNHQGGMKI